MKTWKRNPLLLLVVLTIMSLLLSACGQATILHGFANYTRDRIKDRVSQNGTSDRPDDQNGGSTKITICHKTGSAQNSYVEITISANGARHGHAKHQGDIIPAPKGGCPSVNSTTTTDKDSDSENESEDKADEDQGTSANMITICHKTGSAEHPYVEITVSNDAAKNGHAKHPGDIIPAPQNGCPSTAIATATP